MTIKPATKAEPKKLTELEKKDAEIAALKAQLEAKPSTSTKYDTSKVSAEQASAMLPTELWAISDFFVLKDSKNQNVTKTSAKGNKYNAMVEGADYAWYTLLRSLAIQMFGTPASKGEVCKACKRPHGKPLSDDQINTLRGVLTSAIEAELLEA